MIRETQMGCTKSQLLALLSRIRREIYACNNIDCARRVIDEYIVLIQDRAETEAYKELLKP